MLAAEPFAQLGQGTSAQVSPALRAVLVPETTRVDGDLLLDRDLAGTEQTEVRLRVLARTLPDGRLLAVGVSRRPQEEAGERLAAALVVAGPLLLALVALVVARSVQAALRPVEELTRQARQISAGPDTDRRLPPVTGDDEISRLARTLNEMLSRLTTAFEHERAFVDDASHELRTPLAVLRGELELALSDLDDRAGVEQSLRAALGEAERLSRLAEDLLLLSREQVGALQLRLDDVDLAVLLRRTAARLGPTTGLVLTVDCPPVHLQADADRLEQALTNLVGNAAAAGARAALLRVRTVDDEAHVSVEDDGDGFAPGLAAVAFDRFTRGDAARTRTSGAGLGLSLVEAMAQAHGGSVTADNDSELGGAAVRLVLPWPAPAP